MFPSRLIRGIDLAIPWDDPANSAYFRGIVPDFLNPQIGEFRDARGQAWHDRIAGTVVAAAAAPLRTRRFPPTTAS